MNWLLVLLAWMLGRWSEGRDLTTWSSPPSPGPSPVPRPASAHRPARPSPATVPAAVHTTPREAPAGTPPWPQAVPSGLAPWPSGWEPDEPVGAGVAARATALLPVLWSYGAGTRKTEQTAGRWITYVAAPMAEKRGVVAYRQRAATIPSASPAPAPATVPASTTADHVPGSRTLRRGDQGTDVWYLQGRLGIATDGKFGPQTAASVRSYQASKGLAADGVVGPKTWASLLAVAA